MITWILVLGLNVNINYVRDSEIGAQSTWRAVALQMNALGKKQPSVQENTHSEELRVQRDFPICEISKTKQNSKAYNFPSLSKKSL